MTLFTGISTFYYDNNQIRIRQTFKNGKKHSLHKSWHSNGQLKGEENWINGEENSLHRSWQRRRLTPLPFEFCLDVCSLKYEI